MIHPPFDGPLVPDDGPLTPDDAQPDAPYDGPLVPDDDYDWLYDLP